MKGVAIYELARESITTRGEDPYIWSAQDQCVDLLATSPKASDEIITQMQTLQRQSQSAKCCALGMVLETDLGLLF